MNWIKENKFLTGFFAVLLVGGAALGYLLFAAIGHYGDASDNYDRQAAELSRLQHLHPFPNQENLDKLKDQEKEHQTKVDELQKGLAAMKLPVTPINGVQFQDKLQAAVKDYVQLAAKAGMKLPDKFYLGFQRYQTEPPPPEAAPLLSAELDAMKIVLDDLPNSNVAELERIDRDELPEEKGAAPAPDRRGPPGLNVEKSPAVSRAFNITFIAPKSSPQVILNNMITNQRQFFIPREIRFVDKEDKGPPREVAAAPPPVPTAPAVPANPAVPGAAAAPSAAPGAPTVAPTTIVGNGLVETFMRIEIVNFPDPVVKPSAPAP
jgi:hypothetical protein